MIKYPAPLLIRFLQVLTANANPPRMPMVTAEPRRPTVKRPGRNLFFIRTRRASVSPGFGGFSLQRPGDISEENTWRSPSYEALICSRWLIFLPVYLRRNEKGAIQAGHRYPRVQPSPHPQPSGVYEIIKRKNRFALSGRKSPTTLNGK